MTERPRLHRNCRLASAPQNGAMGVVQPDRRFQAWRAPWRKEAKFPPMGTPEHQEHRLLACLLLRLLTPGPLRMLRRIRRRKFGIDHPRAYATVHLAELRHLTASFAARFG
jgi:hypothetical protein